MKLNSFQLKCIAMITMLIDHIGAILFPGQYLFRMIGRLSFPIFCFLLVEGFYHTRNVEKYMIRLGCFAIISEIPHDLAFQNELLEFEHQNIFFTLLLGLVLMNAIQKTNKTGTRAVYVLMAMWAANTFGLSYDARGILLIMIFYFLRDRVSVKLILGAAWNFLWTQIQWYGAFASGLILLYNGKKGRSMKYLFYVFYPVHLLILYFVSSILIR